MRPGGKNQGRGGVTKSCYLVPRTCQEAEKKLITDSKRQMDVFAVSPKPVGTRTECGRKDKY